MNNNPLRKLGVLCAAAMALAPLVTLSGAAGIATAGLATSRTADLALRPYSSLIATQQAAGLNQLPCLECPPPKPVCTKDCPPPMPWWVPIDL